jgi:uncharacterized membrane protein
MPISFYVIELGCDAFALYCLYNAWKQGTRWLVTVIAASIFGIAVELYFTNTEPGSTHSYYTYGKFLVMVGWTVEKVPLWVGLGWGSIVYASIWTADRLKIPLIAKTTLAGLLAVNIDLSLDPIAELMGFWTWHNVTPKENYYGVPFDNFLGWLMIVGSYAFCLLLLFDKLPSHWKSTQYWVPVVAILPAILLTAGGQLALDQIYQLAHQQIGPFMVIIALAIGVTVTFGHCYRRDLEPNPCVLSLPVFYHLLLLGELVFTGKYRTDASLVVIIPVDLFVAFTAFAWYSLDRIFPQKLG